MAVPNVDIVLGSGGLGRISGNSDGVAGLILTGAAVLVDGELLLNKHYQISSTRNLVTLGVTVENNPLVDKEVRAFYAQAGEGAELHLIVVSEATTLAAMCDPSDGSPLRKLIESAAGRIRLVGVNKIAPEEYVADVTQGIDLDAITALEKAQQTAVSCAAKIQPFRILLPAPDWNGLTTDLFKPSASSFNRAAMVLASDDAVNNTAAIGMVLGRAASMGVHQSIGRVKSGAIATNGYFTSGDTYLEKSGLADSLNDAGYIFFMNITSKNGCYLNGDPMAAPATDDYSALHLGRVIDKAMVIAHTTYISEIMDNIQVDENGQIPIGACKNFEGMIENAIGSGMAGEISSFTAYVDTAQNVLSTGQLTVDCELVPLGVLRKIVVNLAFDNPAV